MKRFLCFIFIILMHLSIFAQNKDIVSMPPVLDLLKYNSCADLESRSSVRIWGWAKSGKVAYTIEKKNWNGSIDTTAVIFNFIYDIVIWERSINSAKEADLQKFYQDFAETRKDHDIKIAPVEYKELPLRSKDKTLELEMSIIREKEGEADKSFDTIASYKIEAIALDKRKIIKERFNPQALELYICGYFVSPFEERALVVTGELVRTFEGHDLDYYFVGAHFYNGFFD